MATGETKVVPTEGVFVEIGYTANTEIFKGKVDLHPNGYIKVQPGSPLTNISS